MRFAGASPISPARASAPPLSTPCSTAISKPSASVALDHRLSVGASGIGLGIARALVASGKVKSNAATTVSESAVGGPAACLAGSCSQATLQQIANAEKTMAVLHLDPERVVAGPGRSAARAGLGERANQQGPDPDREQLDAGSGRSSAITSWPRCSRTCHRAGDGRSSPKVWCDPACGDWWSRVVKLQALSSIAWAFPASSLARKSLQECRFCARSAPKDGAMLLALKSGNFGGPEFFSDALKLMR